MSDVASDASLNTEFQPDVLPVRLGIRAGSEVRVEDFSLDPYAGYTYGGIPIATPEEAADNLNRYDVNWLSGNNGALDDGVLTFGFWNSLAEVQNSYYTEKDANGIILTEDGDYIAAGVFAAFNSAQRAMAISHLQLWDDLIDVEIRPATSAAEADITFGFTQMSPAAGAHAYYPQEEALNEAYGYVDAGEVAGDVWANILHPSSFVNTNIGGYAWFAILHEIGHTFGLAHGGDYNASDDNDGDGNPDPITYEGDAFLAQDTQQYTIMSYFDGAYTGQNALRWSTTGGSYMYAQTPAVHDILAVQNVYGADYETRSGDTVYGFNSTADRAVFDFTKNDTPIVTIWDGGGNDTLDLSGFNSNAIIDINEGAFSSAGYRINAQLEARLIANGWTQANLDALYQSWGLGPDGRPVDNIAIAYGAQIENAVGGSGHDEMIGNALDNLLSGNAGNDQIFGGDGKDRLFGGAGDDFLIGGKGNDIFNGGAGDDLIVVDSFDGAKTVSKVGGLVVEFVQDFNAFGNDTIDLRGIDAIGKTAADDAFHWIGSGANKNAGDLSYKVYDSINGAEKALGIDIDGIDGVGTTSGPVTVVFANVDGGAPDYALVLLGTSGVSQSDFLF